MNGITAEILQTLYKRAIEFAIVKFGRGEPNEVHLTEEGQIAVLFETYLRGGDTDREWEYINVEELSQDLDKVIEERKVREAAEKVQREKEALERRIQINAKEKEARRQKWLTLKKEFGE